MKWMLRNWLGALMLLLCLGLTVSGILVETNVPFASLPVLLAAGVCLSLSVLSHYVPLDFGSYAPKLREHALSAYRLWRSMQRQVNGQVKYENERVAFGMVDWALTNTVWKAVIYRDMSEEEEHFWCAYLAYRQSQDDTVLTHDSGVRGLYEFLRERRTTIEQRERAEMRVVLAPVSPAEPA